MIDLQNDPNASATFQEALEQLRLASQREELEIQQIPAPAKISTHAVAFAAKVVSHKLDASLDHGTGRFVLLYNQADEENWGGNYRVVCYSKSPLETDIGSDELIAEVAWAWLNDSLETRQADFHSVSATATRIISVGFGSLQDQGDHAELEMRASWTAIAPDFARHFEAWQDLICMMSGQPGLPSGVTALSPRQSA
jgi:hypothetical protein